MKPKSITFLVLGAFLASIIFYVIYDRRYQKLTNSSRSEYRKVSTEAGYLERSLTMQTAIGTPKLPVKENKELVIYHQKEACSSCIELVLHIIHEEYSNTNRVTMLAPDSSGIEYIAGINDAFQYSYDVAVDSVRLFNRLTDVLVFKMDNQEIQSVLKFSTGDEEVFKKYFNRLFLEESTNKP